MSREQGREKRRGATLIATAALMAGILPMIGLAIDASLLYTIKAKLSAAVDAAALAGARSLSRGVDLASQTDSAKATAQAFFTANFPEGHLGTHNAVLDMAVAETAQKTRTVKVTGTVSAPSYFLRFMGIGNTPLKASGTASRRDVNMVLILDRSGSMSGAMTAMKAAAANFVNKFADGRDNVGLVVFSNGTIIPFPSSGADDTKMPMSNFKSSSPSVETLIGQTANGGSTDTAGALSKAYKMLTNRNESGALNLIVFFTDGLPNSVTANFSLGSMKTGNGTTCKYQNDVNHPIIGFIARGPAGICNKDASTLSTTPTYVTVNNANTTNCAFVSDKSKYGSDIAKFPALDFYGNATNGPNRYVAVDLTKVTDTNNINAASLNAADDAVQRIRQDKNLNVVIYSIGYSGGAEVPDETWMKRISNDPTSTYFTTAAPQGLYVKAPTTAELSSAFAKVASEILRLSM